MSVILIGVKNYCGHVGGKHTMKKGIFQLYGYRMRVFNIKLAYFKTFYIYFEAAQYTENVSEWVRDLV